MLVINDVMGLPVLDPVFDQKDVLSAVFCGTDHSSQLAVDDHFLADKTGKSGDSIPGSEVASEYVHIASEKTDTGPGGIDDSVLFRMDTPAQLVSLAVRYIQFVSQAETVFRARLCFPGRSHISCGNDLVVLYYQSADRPA